MPSPLCSLKTVSVPSCAKCGALPPYYTRYEESRREGALSVIEKVMLSWHCTMCGSDCSVESKDPVPDGTNVTQASDTL